MVHPFNSSIMFTEGASGSQSKSASSLIPNLNDFPQGNENNEEQNTNVVSNVGDYGNNEGGGIIESDEDEEIAFDDHSSDDENNDGGNAELLNCTVADFTAWIRSQGGMSAFVSSLLPNHALPEGYDATSIDDQRLNNWMLPMIPVDTFESPVLRDMGAIFDEELASGSIFWKKEDLYTVVALWHMEHRAEFRVVRSSTTRIEYQCRRAKSCTFMLRATRRNGGWLVHKFKSVHSCIMNFNSMGYRNVRSKAVAAYFARKITRHGSIIKPRDIMADLQQTFGIKASYTVALRARNAAIIMLYGGQQDSFEMLPKYLSVLEQFNPGTIADLDIGSDGRFQHLFVALGVSRVAFSSLLRQVIVVDATHLKGRNKGVLFVAATKDGNEHIFPLAIGVGLIENDDTWTWFLSRLRVAFGCNDQLLIVSDQHISISNAVNKIYPGTAHGVCYYHLQNKLTGFGPPIVKLYKQAAYAYRFEVYKQAMDQIQQLCPTAYNKLINVRPDRWARSHCRVRRYSFLTSNAAEVFNARMLDARRLPICSIIESFRHILEQWFDQRRSKAYARNDEFTEEAMEKLAPSIELSHSCTVVPTLNLQFKVNDGKRTWKVDLEDHSCECCEFQLDLMPCPHAIAAIRMKGLNPYNYIASYYTTTTWRQVHGGIVNPLPPRAEWMVSSETATTNILPPIVSRQAGRPRNTRRPFGAEAGQSSTSRQQTHKRCSVCGATTHTKPRCPERQSNN